ncbi:adaptor protein MecA [Paenalkalicoccus suaedae]|uniref:Adaptor protein MecA n=1 Tax=Paenalkalicoccus suaedae TaxID=2592382 RepID=A0A859FFS4_9BACI|nr:adaptor protein MecA [Paenalkalicoccus suaedae]QKS71065.1 adaptor protein MecA [Paenalkalicoccus suaedae]
MKVERISKDKMKISLTYEDLEERGIITEDGIESELDEELYEVIIEASDELHFFVGGTLTVEVFADNADGIVIIVSKERELREEGVCYFSSIDHVIEVAKVLYRRGCRDGQLLSFKRFYYLLLQDPDEATEAILSEWGELDDCSHVYVVEHGNMLIENQAIEEIVKRFT